MSLCWATVRQHPQGGNTVISKRYAEALIIDVNNRRPASMSTLWGKSHGHDCTAPFSDRVLRLAVPVGPGRGGARQRLRRGAQRVPRRAVERQLDRALGRAQRPHVPRRPPADQPTLQQPLRPVDQTVQSAPAAGPPEVHPRGGAGAPRPQGRAALPRRLRRADEAAAGPALHASPSLSLRPPPPPCH